jgi:tetratricopeptide (TPR) repeat protein
MLYNQALPITTEVGNRILEAATLNNIGEVHFSIGKPEEALKFYNQVLLIFEAVGDRSREIKPLKAKTLSNMGLVYNHIGQP